MPELSRSLTRIEPGMPQTAVPFTVEPPPMANFSALTNYADVLFKHRMLIVAIALLVTGLAALYAFKVHPVYRATARLEIEPETRYIQSGVDGVQNAPGEEEMFLSTQVDVLQSDNVARQTIEQLQLAAEPEFKAVIDKLPTDKRSPAGVEIALTGEFKQHLIVERQKDTRMLMVHYESHDPQLAAKVANALVENYIEYSFRLKYDATRQATTWMEGQLSDLRKKVQKSQEILVDYEARNSMVNVGDKESIAEQKLADLSRDLTEAQNDRVRKESQRELVGSDTGRARLLSDSPLLQRLQQTEADLKTQYADASQTYGPTFPKVKRLQAQLEEVESLIAREQKRVLDTMNNDYSTAQARERLLTEAVTRQKDEVSRFNELSIQHNLLKRDFDSNQALYDNLLQRMKDATVAAGLRATNIHLIDRAFPPSSPDRPRKARTMLVGLAGGLVLGFLCSLLRETMDFSVNSAEELETLVGVPTLAIVPDAATVPKVLSTRRGLRLQRSAVSTTLLRYPESMLAESFRALRTSVLLSRPDGAHQLVLVTSANPGEGKTCTAVNLALALAQSGGEVLLIDADFRQPRVARSLGLSNERGLSDVLARKADLKDVLIQLPAPELNVLPAGSRPPNPADLLSSRSMRKLLLELRSRFTSVVIDSPPVLLISDATILASLVDAVIIVAESQSTTRAAISRANKMITLSGGRILGTVLNKVDARRDGYYGHYYYRPRYKKYYSN
jgi:succinoglycan biosynthesis transport protein ExoP